MDGIYRGIFVLLSCLLLQGCTLKAEKLDLIGTWKNKDGAVIILNEDGMFSAKEINYFKVYNEPEFKNKKIDFSGKWKSTTTGNQKRAAIDLTSNSTYKDFGIAKKNYIDRNVKEQSMEIGMTLQIAGSGLFENKKPYYLFVNVGDPDDMNKYKFIKQ